MFTYKFRLYPTKEQVTKLWQHSILLTRLYNICLEQRIVVYRQHKKPVTRYDQQAELVDFKNEFPEYKEIYSQVLQQVTDRLDKTYKNFFNRGYGFPRFRSSKEFFTITYPQNGYKLTNKFFITKTYGRIKFLKHREIQGKIKQVSIVYKNNMWFLCVVTDYKKETDNNQRIVGVDLGITNIVATSDGEIIKNQNHVKYFDKQISKLKSYRDKNFKMGSRNYRFYSSVIRRLYGVKSRKIRDFLHKVSRYLADKYDIVFLEDLKLKKMSESEISGLNRELRNSQLAKLISYLSYKTKVIFIDPRNTSKKCCVCGKLYDMPLSQRVLSCKCGNVMDRDVNAAKNILCLGRAMLSAA